MKRVSAQIICLVGAFALCISACGDDEAATKKKTTTTPVTEPEPETPSCAPLTFTSSEVFIDTNNTGQNGDNAAAIMYGISGSQTKFDQLTFETWKVGSQDGSSNWVGPITPGTYKIEEIATGDGSPIDYQTCSLCVTYRSSCSMGQQGATCQKNLFATKGTVVIESIGFAHGEQISVSFSDLTFVPFDPSSGSVQSSGEESCMATASLSATFDDGKARITPYATPDASCVAAGNGNGLSNNVADVTFKKCDGTTVTLHELGCTAANKAIWLATSAEWCAPCKLLDPLYYDLASQNEAIDFYVVLGQRDPSQANMNTEEMMLQVCQNGFGEAGSDWSKVPADHILMDTEWEKSDAAMNDYEAPGIPYGRVLRGSNMEYLWTENAIRDDGTFPTEESALKEASGLDTIIGWDEMIARMNTLFGG